MTRLGWRARFTLTAFFLSIGAFAGAAEKSHTVVMLGDSTTLCRRSRPGHKLTDQVQSNLIKNGKPTVVTVNSGKGGDTIKGAYQRLKQDVFSHSPDVVTVSFGLNDTGSLSPDEFRKWLIKTVEAIQKETSAKILLVTSTPFDNKRHAWRNRFADKGGLDEYMDANLCAQMRDVAKKLKVPLCDLHSLFKTEFKKDPRHVERLIRSDGVHLTEEGNRVAAKHLSPRIRALLDNQSRPKANDANP